MPDTFDASGLTVKTATELTADLVAGLQGIYGADINVDQNSQDGQTIGLITQMCVDIRDLITQVNTSFDPDQAIGTILDQRIAINNLARLGGTYTIQPIQLVVNAPYSLQGLDSQFNNPNGTGYTVQDNNGNEFILIDSVDLSVGTISLSFRAQKLGAVNVPIASITTPVTIVPAITSINNVLAPTTIGQSQELDPQVHTRRERAPAIANSGYLNGLLGKILQLTGVTGAQVYENNSDEIDVNGIPPHAIWLVVAGGANTDIANILYATVSFGANMKGNVAISIETPSNVSFVARFDRPTSSNLYIRFNIKRTVAGYDFDLNSIKAFIAANQVYQIGEFAETSSITAVVAAAIAAQGGGGVGVDVEISLDNSSWTDFLDAPTLASVWALSTVNIFPTIVA